MPESGHASVVTQVTSGRQISHLHDGREGERGKMPVSRYVTSSVIFSCLLMVYWGERPFSEAPRLQRKSQRFRDVLVLSLSAG